MIREASVNDKRNKSNTKEKNFTTLLSLLHLIIELSMVYDKANLFSLSKTPLNLHLCKLTVNEELSRRTVSSTGIFLASY